MEPRKWALKNNVAKTTTNNKLNPGSKWKQIGPKTGQALLSVVIAITMFVIPIQKVNAASGPVTLFTNSGQTLGNSYSWDVSLGDVDGDNDLDAFVANHKSNKVWLNDGNGKFTDSGQTLVDLSSRGVSLGDVDGDNDLDAFVANGNKPNKVWLNDGNGKFTDSGQALGKSSSWDVSLEDVDGDNDLDAFVANYKSQPNKVWLNDGNGKFTDSGQTLGNSDSLRVSLGDVDGDNDLDAFVANHKSQPNKVWLNDGNGKFTDSGQTLGKSSSWDVSLGDVDGDNDLDAFVANLNRPNSNKVWLNDGKGKFTDSGQALGNSNSRSVSLGDVDGDNDLDAFVGNFNRKSNKVWLNDGNGKFTDSGQDFGKSTSQDVSLGDVDGDNDLDAFVANENADKIQPNEVWYNNIDPSPTCDNTSGNQVVNGSFEAPEIKFLQFEKSIKGWNLVEGPYIELDSSKIVKPYDGSQVLDLDSINARTKISQKISTVPGKTYKLSFAYQASNNICPDAEHQKLNVYFGNELVDAIDEVDSNTEWQEKTYYLTAQSKQTVLSFDNLNEKIADGFGIRLDDITLKKCRK